MDNKEKLRTLLLKMAVRKVKEDGEASKPIKYNNQQNGAIKGKIISANSTTVSDGKYLVVTTTILVEES